MLCCSSGPTYSQLKTNLRLAITRLKLMEKKKTELAMRARNEIADYISQNKYDRARIRVEQIIREDYLVEAYELVETYCDLLVTRFGLIQQMRAPEASIEEAVQSILWAAPRLMCEIPELNVISSHLTAKYGKRFASACRANQLGKVNSKLQQKLSVYEPPKVLVEKYMIEIAKCHDIPFTPDPNVMRFDESGGSDEIQLDLQDKQQSAHASAYPREMKVHFVDSGQGELRPAPPPYSNYPVFPQPPTNFPYKPPQDSDGSQGASCSGGPMAPIDDLDFEDLTRRFEQLKKKR